MRPTPLLLRYRPGDYNRLHQDLYGDISFPIQVTILLDRPGIDFTGGEFVLTEQKARAQSRAQVVPLQQGDAVAFAVNERPAQGARGYYRLRMRHGVSELYTGLRHTLGIIFHDAALARILHQPSAAFHLTMNVVRSSPVLPLAGSCA